ncbi:hypothetical protein BO78DRAFT_467165 [Aspergillus sclerotiicarbonarius CBS 121057]|uniref:Uncharacterized protein n=1 Tax=Aspergillus sclerotiicarbonarius (strain CBS 121057 / IBT 28362) TaxID=1448318 RepID=A0A319ERJ2_ASPSB|nr:hypothetical protein BO78DRAFT_467165 [Aspergillus sclerotiicarbonarius CBS 121057]
MAGLAMCVPGADGEGRRKLLDSCTGPGLGFHRFHRPTVRVCGQGLPSLSRLVSPMRDESAPNAGGRRILAPTDGFQPIRAPTESGPSMPSESLASEPPAPRATQPGFWGRCNVKAFKSINPSPSLLWPYAELVPLHALAGASKQHPPPLPSPRVLYKAGVELRVHFSERAL